MESTPLKTARRIGGGKTVQTLLFTVAAVELWHLRQETRGDFANGILFYLAGELNPVVILGYAILFSGIYFLGRMAGKEILILRKNFVWVGLKYFLFSLGIFSVFLIAVLAPNQTPDDAWQLFAYGVSRLAILLLVTWIWSSWRIKPFTAHP